MLKYLLIALSLFALQAAAAKIDIQASPVEKVEEPDTLSCEACTFIVGWLESYIAANPNATEAEIEKELDALCNVLGPYASECTAFVNAELPQILTWIENETPQQICQYVHLCTSADAKKPSAQFVAPLVKLVEASNKKVKGAEALPCSLCEIVVGYAESFIEANPNATVAEVEKLLGEFCNLLGSYAAECTAFVDAETPQIVQYLESMTPQQVCAAIGLCSSNQATPLVKLQDPVAKLTPAVKLVAAKQDKKEAEVAVKGSSMGCAACTLIVGYVQGYIKANGNNTEAELQKKLDALCTDLGKEATECTLFVNNLLPQVAKWVQSESVATICSELHLCGSRKRTVAPTVTRGGAKKSHHMNVVHKQAMAEGPKVAETFPLTKLQQPAAVGSAGDLPCSACEMIFSFIDQFLQANPNATDKDIEGALDLVCDILPKAYKSECEAFVAAEVPQLVQYVLDYTPQQLCAAVGLCSSSALAAAGAPRSAVKAVAKVEDGSGKCALCKTVMTFLQAYLEANQNETEAQLQAIGDKFCQALPEPYNVTCLYIVNTELPVLFSKMLKETPEQLCQAVHLCNNVTALAADSLHGLRVLGGYKADGTALRAVKAGLLRANNTIGCPVCKTLMSLISGWVASHPKFSDATLKAKVTEYCDILPGAWLENKCITTFEPKVLTVKKKLLTETPEELCQDIKTCPKTMERVTFEKAGVHRVA